MSRNTKTTALLSRLTDGLSLRRVALIMLGAMIATFGIHNIHQRTGITEGGVIGLMLLLEQWLGASPAFLTPVLDLSCYLLAFKYLGGRFIKISVVSTLSVSLFYKLWEQLPFLLPDLSAHPLAAAVLGAVFVGVGVGLIVRQGGSSGGDDALALTISTSGPLLSLHRSGGAGVVPQLHPLPAHRLLPHHRHPLLLADRPGTGLRAPPPRPGRGIRKRPLPFAGNGRFFHTPALQ